MLKLRKSRRRSARMRRFRGWRWVKAAGEITRRTPDGTPSVAVGSGSGAENQEQREERGLGEMHGDLRLPRGGWAFPTRMQVEQR